MTHSISSIGTELSCIIYGVQENNPEKLKRILLDALKMDEFTCIDFAEHKFSPHGYTIIILIAESHAALHTYPEFESLYFHLYSCRGEDDGKKTILYLLKNLPHESYSLHQQTVPVLKKTANNNRN